MELGGPFGCSILQAMCSLERLQSQLGSEPHRKYSNQVIGYFELKYMLVIESVREAGTFLRSLLPKAQASSSAGPGQDRALPP